MKALFVESFDDWASTSLQATEAAATFNGEQASQRGQLGLAQQDLARSRR